MRLPSGRQAAPQALGALPRPDIPARFVAQRCLQVGGHAAVAPPDLLCRRRNHRRPDTFVEHRLKR